MLNTIFGIVGWIGTLLVFAGVAIRLFRPEWDQYAYWAAVGGLVCVGLYTLTQWREIGRSFQKRETKLGAMMSISVIAVLAILIGINWAGGAPRQAVGSHGGRVVHALGSDRQGAEQPEDAGQGARLRSPGGFQRFRDSLTMYTNASPNVQVEYVDLDREPARAREYDDRDARHGRHGVRRAPRERDERTRAGPDERPHQGDDGPADQGVFRAGPRRARQRRQRPARLRQRRRCAEARQLHGRERSCLRSRRAAFPPMRRC